MNESNKKENVSIDFHKRGGNSVPAVSDGKTEKTPEWL